MPSKKGRVFDAVLAAAERLYGDLMGQESRGDGLAILSRLVSDRRMETVWTNLYKNKRIGYKPTNEFLYPAAVTGRSSARRRRQKADELRTKSKLNELEARLLEAEAAAEERLPFSALDSSWSEQDIGVQWFLEHACRSAIDIIPIYQSDLEFHAKQLREDIEGLQTYRDALIAHGLDDQHLSTYLAALEEDEMAMLPPDTSDIAWIIKRDRGNAKQRTYAVGLSEVTHSIFGSRLPGVIAIVTNVVFEVYSFRNAPNVEPSASSGLSAGGPSCSNTDFQFSQFFRAIFKSASVMP